MDVCNATRTVFLLFTMFSFQRIRITMAVKFSSLKSLQEVAIRGYIYVETGDHGWQGADYILSIMPTVDWVFLGSGESNKGQDFGSLCVQLVCGCTLLLGRESV